MTEIVLLRHGQSYGNKNKILLGITDLSLTEEGVSQAEIAAEHLREERFDAIYSSDLKRAYYTAKPHEKYHGCEVVVSKELREEYNGVWDGMPLEEVLENYYDEFKNKFQLRDFRYPSGESHREASERLHNEFIRIAKLHDGGKVLIVSHSVAIRSFWYFLTNQTTLNMNDSVERMNNCAYARMIYENGRLFPVSYNEKDHLPPTDVVPLQ